MIAPCTCGSLAKWAKDPDIPIVERNGGYLLGDASIDDEERQRRFVDEAYLEIKRRTGETEAADGDVGPTRWRLKA